MLKKVWDEGAVALYRKPKKWKGLIEDMSRDGFVSDYGKLFAPDEADYCNFMFNNAKFSNPLALRNKYDHANSAIRNPNSDECRFDYYKLLVLLVCITLKIVDDLSCALGKGA